VTEFGEPIALSKNPSKAFEKAADIPAPKKDPAAQPECNLRSSTLSSDKKPTG